METFRVGAWLEVGIAMNIEAETEEQAQQKLIALIEDDDIPEGADVVHRDYGQA